MSLAVLGKPRAIRAGGSTRRLSVTCKAVQDHGAWASRLVTAACSTAVAASLVLAPSASLAAKLACGYDPLADTPSREVVLSVSRSAPLPNLSGLPDSLALLMVEAKLQGNTNVHHNFSEPVASLASLPEDTGLPDSLAALFLSAEAAQFAPDFSKTVGSAGTVDLETLEAALPAVPQEPGAISPDSVDTSIVDTAVVIATEGDFEDWDVCTFREC